MSIGRFVSPRLCTLCSHLPPQGMTQVCFYAQIQGGSYVELQLRALKHGEEWGSLCTLWGGNRAGGA